MGRQIPKVESKDPSPPTDCMAFLLCQYNFVGVVEWSELDLLLLAVLLATYSCFCFPGVPPFLTIFNNNLFNAQSSASNF